MIKLLDRVKIIEDYKLQNGFILKANTLGTCRKINEFEFTLQIKLDVVNFQGVKSRLVTQAIVPDLILDLATQDDIDKFVNEDDTNYEYLIPKIYYINNLWSIKSGYDENNVIIYRPGIIKNYFIKQNENDDTVLIHYLDDIEKFKLDNIPIKDYIYKKRYLDRFGSYSILF